MFSSIRKKLNISVLIIVGAILIFSFSSLYGSFRMILDKSYSESTARFARQEVLNSSVTLATVASSIDAMTKFNGFESAARTYNAYFINNVRNAIQYYPYYNSFVMFSDGEPMYYFGYIHRDKAMLDDISAAIGDADSGWSIFDNKLIYIRKYRTDGKTAYAAFGINTDVAAADFASDNTFAGHNCVYIAAQNGNGIILQGDSKTDFDSDACADRFGSKIYSEKIGGTNLTAHISNRSAYTDRRSAATISLCIIVGTLIMLICYLTVNRLGLEIEHQLDKIHNQMQNY